jgi:hypothetical protein
MPALLMHVQAAARVRRDQLIPARLAPAVDEATWAYRLGSFLVDLPLFDRFWLKVGLFFLHRPYPESLWGTVVHTRGSVSLAQALLKRSGREHRAALEALVAGLLTHIAFDRSMHPPIEEAVRQHLRPDESHAQLHEALENYQSLIWHREHLSCDGLGTSYLREGVSVGPKKKGGMPSWLRSALRESLAEVYGQGPSDDEVRRWVGGICAYRDLLGGRLGSISVRSSEHLEARRPWVKEVELEGAWDRGLERSGEYLDHAARALEEDHHDLAVALGDGPLV